jgi:hypothetical protein
MDRNNGYGNYFVCRASRRASPRNWHIEKNRTTPTPVTVEPEAGGRPCGTLASLRYDPYSLANVFFQKQSQYEQQLWRCSTLLQKSDRGRLAQLRIHAKPHDISSRTAERVPFRNWARLSACVASALRSTSQVRAIGRQPDKTLPERIFPCRRG